MSAKHLEIPSSAPGPATTNCDFEAQLAREVDGIDHVGHATTSGDQRRALVHQTVVDPSRFLVPHVRRLQELPRERAGKFYDGVGNGWN